MMFKTSGDLISRCWNKKPGEKWKVQWCLMRKRNDTWNWPKGSLTAMLTEVWPVLQIPHVHVNITCPSFWTASKGAWRVVITVLYHSKATMALGTAKIWFDLYQLLQLAECNINWIILKSIVRRNAAAQDFQSTGKHRGNHLFHGASFDLFPFQFLRNMSRFPLLTHICTWK